MLSNKILLHDLAYVFCIVYQLLRVVLFGKSLLTAKNFKFGESLVGRRWNVRCVNDSMIAFAAIAVCPFILLSCIMELT